MINLAASFATPIATGTVIGCADFLWTVVSFKVGSFAGLKFPEMAESKKNSY